LVSGRPISFRMDLYNPLYVQRPLVEPELFASLRPPTYSGAMSNLKSPEEQLKHLIELEQVERDALSSAAGTREGLRFITEARQKLEQEIAMKEKWGAASQIRRGVGGGDDLEKRKQYAEAFGRELSARMDAGKAAQSVATASQLGDYFQYTIDIPVSLGRQKSALLPVVNKEIEGKRVSIYNPNVQAKHPLLGLKFKNTSGMNLAQGPITVFEGSTYAGDTRVLDLQQNEERLVSYAIDLGTEVSTKNGNNTSKITKVKANKGVVFTETLIREERVCDLVNRSDKDRVILIEHPNRKGQGFVFKGDNKPAEEAADVFRFETTLSAGKNTSYTIVEERTQGTQFILTNSGDEQIRWFISLNEASPELKAKLKQALEIKGKWDGTVREIQNIQRRINTITQDQNRLRQNLREMPKEAEAYKTYLKKFDEQEKEMTSLHEKLKNLQTQEEADRAGYENYLATLTVE
jgi:hypothetical protein